MAPMAARVSAISALAKAKALALRQATAPLLIVEVQDELYGAPAQSLHGTDY